jgi:NifU-like protein involved in Fe-S cluster formation
VFSAQVLDHTLNPRNTGPLEGANRFGQAGDPGGGPYVLLWFIVEGQQIKQGSYQTYGCPAAVACASFAAEFLAGKTIQQALAMDAKDISLLLGGLPEGKGHCPALVVTVLGRAFAEDLK